MSDLNKKTKLILGYAHVVTQQLSLGKPKESSLQSSLVKIREELGMSHREIMQEASRIITDSVS